MILLSQKWGDYHMSTTGERIRELRQLHHLTLDDVARHLGIGRQAVYKYEQGTVTNIPLDNLEKMAQLFGTTPGYLAGWSDDKPPTPDDLPKNDDVRLLIRGLNKLSPEQLTQATNMMKIMFTKYAEYFDKENDNDT